MTVVRVFASPPVISDVTMPGLDVRSYATPGEVAKALAFLRWHAGTVAVVDLGLRGLLGQDVVDYITSRHPAVGLWGIADLCAGDVVDVIAQMSDHRGQGLRNTNNASQRPSRDPCPPDSGDV